MKKNLAKKLLDVFADSDDKNLEGFKAFDEGVAKLKKELKEKIQINTLDDVNNEIDKFRKTIDLDPIVNAIEQIKVGVDKNDTSLRNEIETSLQALYDELSDARGKNKDSVGSLETEIAKLEAKLLEVSSRKFPEFPDFITPIKESESRVVKIINNLEKFDDSALEKEVENLNEKIEAVRKDLVQRINDKGGGGMNRQILISSADPLTKYTDINLKAGANTTITYADNNTTKKVDITITATGSGSGITRVITSVAVDTAAGSTAGVDYVYLVSGTTTITLPTAVGNENLYTIKNVGVGVVTVATTLAQTIDGDTTITMPVQYTSVDIVSDTANWSIT